LVVALLGAFVAPGCGSDDDAPSGEAPPAATNDALHGDVVVAFTAPADDLAGYATILGRFFDGPTPATIPLELDTEIGDCQLLVPVIPFCDSPCAPDACTADDVCTSYPMPLGVGPLTVEGLGDAALMLAPATSMMVYQAPSLPFPPCAEGGLVHASATELELEAECIAPLELTGPDPIPVTSGEAVEVAWIAAESSSSSRIRIGLDIAHHGGKKGEIRCDVDDSGAFSIPEPLVTKLVSLGLAGYPTINVSRVARGGDARYANVALVLSASVTRGVDTGVRSCQDDQQCESGEACLDTRICG
jgi:hypothetical protein